MGKFNVYQAVTDRIITQLEEGVIPWHKPWTGLASGAFNRVSKKPYSLLNQMLLKYNGEYATYKQWSELGGRIRKGEKSEIVVFWKIFRVADTDCYGEEVIKSIPMLKYINVFHISQVEGVEPLDMDIVEHEPIAEAEKIKDEYSKRENILIKETISNDAFYSPMMDYIKVPCKEQYEDITEFYSTLFHEMVHSTGHKDRLARLDMGIELAAFGSDDYSKEELVAELGSSFLMNKIGIETDKTFKNSSGYIQGWLKVLKGDNRFIVTAAGKAEKAVNFILNSNEEKVLQS